MPYTNAVLKPTLAALPRLLVVVPCLNEEHDLERVVRKLLRSACSPVMRLVIVDGGSDDQTPALGKALAQNHANVFFLENPRRIQSAAINLAVAIYGNDCEFLLRADAHADYPDDYGDVLLDEAELTGATSVVVAMNAHGKNWFQKAVAFAQNSRLGNGGALHRGIAKPSQWIDHGHHALIRLDVFRALGGYDESFSHNEDAEFDFRLGRAGHKIWLTGKTSLVYYPRSSPTHLFFQYANYGHGRARNLSKHAASPKLRQIIPALVLPSGLLALTSPWSQTMALPFDFWTSACLLYGLFLGLNKKSFSALASGPAAMLMHLGWSFGFWRCVFATLWKRTT